MNLIAAKDKMIDVNRVVCLATLLSALVHSYNRDNNALAKMKSVMLKKEGLTNECLDALGTTGICESSRSQRRDRHFLSGISTEVLKSASKKFPHVFWI